MTSNMTSNATRLLYPIPAAQEQLGIGRSTVYELIAKGDLQTVKIGSRTLISHDELARYARSLTETTAVVGGGDAASEQKRPRGQRGRIRTLQGGRPLGIQPTCWNR
jgi:excisionase family DNA binding protein